MQIAAFALPTTRANCRSVTLNQTTAMKSALVASATLIGFTFAFPVTTGATEVVWQPFGPSGGGWIEDVVAHPANPAEVWAMTDISGL
ncbi:MAG: hypothetical protein N2689_16385, partial [Verrucomicrobiae bacterium]|nr:hypothetical protein [Verrucomicrobiae bacterium]